MSALVSTSTGVHAAGLDQQQVALDAARIEVGVEADHDEHGVDVRGDQLQLVVLAGGAALEHRAARQQCDDRFRGRALPASSSSTQSPTIARSSLGCALAVPVGALPSGGDCVRVAVAGTLGDVEAAAVLAGHPRRPRRRLRAAVAAHRTRRGDRSAGR